MSWTTVILIAGLIPISQAIASTGAADDVADILVDVVGGSSPHLLLAGLFVLAAAFGVAVNNTATALILIPSGSRQPQSWTWPRRRCSSASRSPARPPSSLRSRRRENMIVMGPGGYRFGDYWPFGLPFLVLFFVVAVLLVPVIWSV